ncbi:MAG: class I SAM-dependent methyltransferase [Balneolaceae bacterium]
MKSLFKIIHEVRHADWPFIIQSFFFYLLFLIAGAYLIENSEIIILYAIGLTSFFLLTTLFHVYRILKKEFGFLQYKIQALQEIYHLLSIRSPLPSMTSWAATPELAIKVIELIQTHKPNIIVELGSGITTLLSGYALERFHPDGKLISIDHDPIYTEKTLNKIHHHKLEKFIELRNAPLTKTELNGKRWNWYNTDQLHFDKTIDLVIVDGPPVKTQKDARYPALPLLFNHLSQSSVIIIHDTHRDAESRIVDSWLENFPVFEKEPFSTEKGITILYKNSSLTKKSKI